MQRAVRHEVRQEAPPPQEDYPSAVHPLHRYTVPQAAPEPDYHPVPAQSYDAEEQYDPDPSRYDEALYGALETGLQNPHHDPAYAEDAYAYQDGYEDDGTEDRTPKRRGGLATVVGVLALAVVGTGAAFAYKTYMGSPRSGDPPIIRADTGPTKIMPAPADGSAKVPDRMAAGDGTEKIVPREETPLDINAKSGPRVVFPPLNQNGNPPPVASVTPTALPPSNAGNGTLPNNEPRKIKTLSVRGEQPDGAALPVAAAPPAAAKPAARTVVASRTPPPAVANANDSATNAPLSLSPQGAQAAAPAAEPRTRMAATTPAQIVPQAAPSNSAGGGGYLVQVSSQRNEADAQASYRTLQGKFPAVLGSRSPVIKRADLGDKGVYYRAMVGPYDSPDQAKQLCGDLKAAGGQCNVVKY